jgi:catechol-2,3-dioxygenase
MQLNHLNLCVNDLTGARSFFQNCFGFQCLEQKGDAVAIITDGHGFTLVLSNPRAFKREIMPYPEDFHVGFLQETPDQVDQMYHLLGEAGVQLSQEPRKMRGSYGFYFTALNDILFEISCSL